MIFSLNYVTIWYLVTQQITSLNLAAPIPDNKSTLIQTVHLCHAMNNKDDDTVMKDYQPRCFDQIRSENGLFTCFKYVPSLCLLNDMMYDVPYALIKIWHCQLSSRCQGLWGDWR